MINPASPTPQAATNPRPTPEDALAVVLVLAEGVGVTAAVAVAPNLARKEGTLPTIGSYSVVGVVSLMVPSLEGGEEEEEKKTRQFGKSKVEKDEKESRRTSTTCLREGEK